MKTRHIVIGGVLLIAAAGVLWYVVDERNRLAPASDDQIANMLAAPPTRCRTSDTDLYIYEGKIRVDHVGSNGVKVHVVADAIDGFTWADGGREIYTLTRADIYQYKTSGLFAAFENGSCTPWNNPSETLFNPPDLPLRGPLYNGG